MLIKVGLTFKQNLLYFNAPLKVHFRNLIAFFIGSDRFHPEGLSFV